MTERFKWRKPKPKPKPMQNEKSAQQKDAESEEKSSHPQSNAKTSVEIEFGKNLKKQHQAEQTQATTHSNWQLAGTFITAGLVFLYTLVSLWQGCSTQKLVTISQKQQRPYLWIAPADFGRSSDAKRNVVFERVITTLSATSIYQNYGGSPAIVVRFMGDTEIGPNALGKLHETDWHDVRRVTPPGKTDALKIYAPENSVAADNHSPEVASFAKIQYRDMGGHLFESDWCFSSQHSDSDAGTPEPCPMSLNRTRIIDCEEDVCAK